MAYPTAVLNIVGLTAALLEGAMPRLKARLGPRPRVALEPVLPAVTCSVQASMLTGQMPAAHGIVGNGWYHRDLAEVRFWQRSNHLITAPQIWHTARRRDPSVTCANCFWWHNTYADCETVLNVRPMYTADGRKLPDCFSQPASWRDLLQERLGPFPLFHFWGPAADIRSSRWIAQAARMIHEQARPTLLLVYLPHLDYALQRHGPDHPASLQAAAEIDGVADELLDYLEADGVRTLVVSEYGIEPVHQAVAINRHLRKAGLLSVRMELGRELLEAGMSEAFAVVDHQIAHVYVRNPARVAQVAQCCAAVDGVERVLDENAKERAGLNHPRSGELVLVAAEGHWFTYDWWLDTAKAPDYARTVDIHRKPGYDPRELFIDPGLRWPRVQLAGKLLKRKLGFRGLLDVIPLDTNLVRGSHGRITSTPATQPLMILPAGAQDPATASLPCTAVHDAMLSSLFAVTPCCPAKGT